MRNVNIPVKIAEEYASQFFDREKEEEKWLIIRNAWLNGWNRHRLVYPEMQQNMTREEKDLLLRDLCARLPYGVKGLHRGEKQELLVMDSFGSYQVNGYDAWFDLNSVIFKPYLRPMSSMTEEELAEYNRFELSDFRRIDWLNAHHFDYRGLIEKGLALEMPKDMYK